MVIYDSVNKTLFIPDNGDRLLFDPDEVYQKGYDMGYQEGLRVAEEECQNQNEG